MGLHYQAEVKCFTLDGVGIYDVYYSLRPKPVPALRVQLYAGKGNGPVKYWRQRITGPDDELLEPAFVEAMGYAIDQAELSNP